VNPLLLRAFLAALTVLDLALDPGSALLTAAAVLFFLFAAAPIFFVVRPALPESVRRLSFLLLVLVLVLVAGRVSFAGIWGHEARIIFPLLLLLPPEFFRPRRNWDPAAKHLFFSAAAFGALLVLHGLAAGFLSFGGRFEYFRVPAGSYFLLGLLAWVAGKR